MNIDVYIPDPDSDILEIDSTNATTVVDPLDLEIGDFDTISEANSLSLEIPDFGINSEGDSLDLEIPNFDADFEAEDLTDNSSEISSVPDDPQDPDWKIEDFDSDDSD